MFDLQYRRSHLRYRIPHRTYDIKQYRRYDVAYDVVGHTYDIVVTDLGYRRWPTISYVSRIQMFSETRPLAASLASLSVCRKFGTDLRLPTSVLLPESRFCHTTCTLGFNLKMHHDFKLVDIQVYGVSISEPQIWLTGLILKVYKYSFIEPDLIFPFQTCSEANSYYTTSVQWN